MQEIIISLTNKFGYFGVFFLIAIENIFPPIPSEVILTFSGYLTTVSNLNVYLVILFSTLGSLVGAIVLYLIGKILNEERLIKIVEGKIGKILHLKKKDIVKSIDWFESKGEKCVFFCRFIPVVRSLISIPAGISNMKIPKFLILTTIGSIIWNTVLVSLGNIVGENWEKIANIFDAYSTIATIILIIFIIIFVFWYYKSRIKKNKK